MNRKLFILTGLLVLAAMGWAITKAVRAKLEPPHAAEAYCQSAKWHLISTAAQMGRQHIEELGSALAAYRAQPAANDGGKGVL